jgi:hypothetical protein
MKPAAFAYAKASSLDHAIELLGRASGEPGRVGAPGAVMNAVNDALAPRWAQRRSPKCRSRPAWCCARWARCEHMGGNQE